MDQIVFKFKITVLIANAFLVLAVFSHVGLAGDSSVKTETESRPARANPLIISLEGGDIGYPTPYNHYPRGPGLYKMCLIFDSLLERSEKGHVPWLAEKWKISGDGKTFTFKLRKNVKWHDGNMLTSDDVKFSFQYLEKNPPVFDDLSIDGKSIIEKIDIIDTHTIRIRISRPSATFLNKAGRTRIIPKHIWEKVEDPKKFNDPRAVIGCGPYMLKAYNKEQGSYQFVAFRDYWGQKPLVDILQFVPVSDPILAFHAGEIDLAEVAPDLLSRFAGNPEFKIIQNPAFWGYRLIFNLDKRQEFKDKNLRQAFAHAIDKDELIEKVARGAAVPGSGGYLPPDHIWYNKDVKEYNFDINKAKALLRNRTLSFSLTIANTRDEIRIAELIKMSLAKAGVEITIKSVDMKTRDAAVKKGNYEIAVNGHGGFGNDPDMLRTVYSSTRTFDHSPISDSIPGYINPQINGLCEKQSIEMNEMKRKQIIFELQEVIAEEIPQIPLYYTRKYVVYRPSKYDGWKYMFDHHEVTHNKLSYLTKNEGF